MNVTISGSYRKHLDRILLAKRAFEELGATVLRPHTEDVAQNEDGLVRLEGDPKDTRSIQREQLRAIANSNMLYVVNPAGYIGPSANLEIGYALRAGTPIFTSEPPFEEAIASVINGVRKPEEALDLLRSE